MKVLLDTCIWGGAVAVIRDADHEVTWTGSWEEDPGDEEILARAHRDRAVLVTLDKDFGELAVVRAVQHSGIIRLVGIPARGQGTACLAAIERYGDELSRGALVTVEPSRFRVRPPADD